MKITMIVLAVFSIAMSGLCAFMLIRSDSAGMIALWVCLLVLNFFNVIQAGKALGRM